MAAMAFVGLSIFLGATPNPISSYWSGVFFLIGLGLLVMTIGAGAGR